MKKNLYITTLLLSAIMLVLFVRTHAVAADGETLKKEQLIKFSHSKHIAAKSECLQCHKAIESMSAEDRILPRHNECETCHEKEMVEDCSYCHFDDNLAALPNPERKTNFSHKVHVTDKKSACESCHQGLEKTDFASETNLPSKATCDKCHTSGTIKY